MVMTVMVLYHGAEFKPLAFRDGQRWQKVKPGSKNGSNRRVIASFTTS